MNGTSISTNIKKKQDGTKINPNIFIAFSKDIFFSILSEI